MGGDQSEQLGGLPAEAYTPEIGSLFEVMPSGERGPVPLRLVAVDPAAPAPAAGRTPFTLTFEGPARPVLAQDTHLVNHPRLGASPLFLGPFALGADGAVRYLAVFN